MEFIKYFNFPSKSFQEHRSSWRYSVLSFWRNSMERTLAKISSAFKAWCLCFFFLICLTRVVLTTNRSSAVFKSSLLTFTEYYWLFPELPSASFSLKVCHFVHQRFWRVLHEITFIVTNLNLFQLGKWFCGFLYCLKSNREPLESGILSAKGKNAAGCTWHNSTAPGVLVGFWAT